MADNVMTFRYVIKEVALNEESRATFMPSRSVSTPARRCTPT